MNDFVLFRSGKGRPDLIRPPVFTSVGYCGNTYLGAGLSAADIAGAAIQNGARAVALSIVYPEDDPHLKAEFARLRELLPTMVIVAGGRAASAYRDALEKIDAIQASDLAGLGEILDRLRKPPRVDARLPPVT